MAGEKTHLMRKPWKCYFRSGVYDAVGRLDRRTGAALAHDDLQEQGHELKTILLMRHAKAGEGGSSLPDFDRCLTDKGIEMSRRTGICLRSLGIRIERVISSSAVRTKQTAEFVAEEVCPSVPLVLLDDLYLAPANSFAQSVREQAFEDESCVLVVGHNPGIADLMCQWAEQNLSVPTSTLTIFQSTAANWTGVRNGAAAAPRLLRVIQKGHIVWQEPSLGVPLVPAD